MSLGASNPRCLCELTHFLDIVVVKPRCQKLKCIWTTAEEVGPEPDHPAPGNSSNNLKSARIMGSQVSFQVGSSKTTWCKRRASYASVCLAMATHFKAYHLFIGCGTHNRRNVVYRTLVWNKTLQFLWWNCQFGGILQFRPNSRIRLILPRIPEVTRPTITSSAPVALRSAQGPWPGLSCPSKMNSIPTQNFLALAIAGDGHWKILEKWICFSRTTKELLTCKLRVPRPNISWGLV